MDRPAGTPRLRFAFHNHLDDPYNHCRQGTGRPRIADDGLPLPSASRGSHGDQVLSGRVRNISRSIQAGLSAEVIVVEPTGAETQVALRLASLAVMAAFRDRIGAQPGDRLALWPMASEAHLFDAAAGQRLN
ncbi:hypothetical protein QTH98_25545 [Variovorax sp. J22G47]|nr:hypothetical protein [Variovorax sp. J22G47]